MIDPSPRGSAPIALVLLVLLNLTACAKPDGRALQKLACEQAAGNLDLQSVQQLDLLRKALGVAPDVDPLAFCRSLGVSLQPGEERS
jgi:hypothetical protein